MDPNGLKYKLIEFVAFNYQLKFQMQNCKKLCSIKCYLFDFLQSIHH